MAGAPPGGGGGGARGVRRSRDGEIPEETAGPYPGDGSNGVNVLSESGIVRSDLTSSFGSASRGGRGRAGDGRPQGLRPQRHRHRRRSPAPRSTSGTATARARYSLYSDGVTDENYLRGVQETDADGSRAVHHDLPGLLRRPLAAHALRGLPVAGRRRRATPTSCAPPSSPSPRTPAGGLRRRRRVRRQRGQPRPGQPGQRHASSATATRSSSRRVTGSVDEGYTFKLNVPV